MKSVIVDCEKLSANLCYEYESGSRGNKKKVIQFLKNRKTKKDEIGWDVIYPHHNFKRWKGCENLFSFSQSHLVKLFPKGEDFWNDWVNVKTDVNHDFTNWFGNKYKKAT